MDLFYNKNPQSDFIKKYFNDVLSFSVCQFI